MGVDLTLLPVEEWPATETRPAWGFAHTMLRLHRWPSLWPRSEALPTTAPPADFSTYLAEGPDGESCYGRVTETPYGLPLTCVTVKQLLTVRGRAEVRGAAVNRAIWAYLAALPPTQRVALWWS